MAELMTYLYPAVQALFCLVIGIVWLAGFVRHRNFGFILLSLATLAEALVSLTRQAFLNYVYFHQTQLSATQRAGTAQMIAMTVLGINVVLWIAIALGAVLVVFYRSKRQTSTVAPPPPVSG